MSFRNRHRWYRRLVLSLAFGLLAVPAQAKPLPAGPGHDDTAVAAAAAQQAGDPYLTDIPSRPLVVDATGPDGTSLTTPGDAVATPVRPDDRAERFTVSGGEVAVVADNGSAVDWDNGLTIGLGALALALALGIAVALLRRPRIAL